MYRPLLEASHSTVNGLSKFGRAKTRVQFFGMIIKTKRSKGGRVDYRGCIDLTLESKICRIQILDIQGKIDQDVCL